ncbi:hypothetical protein LAZ67_19001370 [Cordylochernes scorpioides]|uniref:ATP-dependent DNA helicase n=1 Tax=Cordylochernes scorpioides TaxID=51811 RepID=A0ABY6LHL6_9ARAC|nr:hypothetical protein LAZ67_19001370 [Cordylochernes scorpioides]
MVILRRCSHVLEAQILTETKVRHMHWYTKISLAPLDINLPFILKRCQFPLRSAFSLTINKAQGQTFARVGLLLQEPMFTHGQLFVAFPRVWALDSIHVKLNSRIYHGIKLEIRATDSQSSALQLPSIPKKVLLGLTHLNPRSMTSLPDATSAWKFLVNWFNSAIKTGRK